jgi:hypothetical protein
MLGNNFSNLKFNGLDFWIPGASDGYRILLFGSLNTVVGGGNNGTTVFNLGTGNKITGAKIENEG